MNAIDEIDGSISLVVQDADQGDEEAQTNGDTLIEAEE